MGKKSRRRNKETPGRRQAAANASADAASLNALMRGGSTESIADFRALCSTVDGMPPLWPHPPRWPFDPELTQRYARELKYPLMMITPPEQQRIPDMAHRHFNYLIHLHEKDGDVRPASEWASIVCGPSCWEPYHLGSDQTSCTAVEFKSRMDKEVFGGIGFRFARAYEIPEKPIPVYCDNVKCGKECTSVCGCCGEVYCSRKCMKKDWSRHRQVCEQVYDQMGYIDSFITQMEMKENLSDKEIEIAFGIKDASKVDEMKAEAKVESALKAIKLGESLGSCHTCNMPGAMNECHGCGVAIYCNEACQRHHWPVHKRECKEMSAGKNKKKGGGVRPSGAR